MHRRTILRLIAWMVCLLTSEQGAKSQNAVSEEVVISGGAPRSITTPTQEEARKQKSEVPGALTLRSTEDARLGRTSNFEDVLQRTPGLFTQTQSDAEVSKISIRGSGIDADDEPVGVMILLDGLNYNQGDGEVNLEDIDLSSIRYAEIFRGASGFKYGAITLGGAINLVPATGYNADRFAISLDGGSFGFFRGNISSGQVLAPLDYFASLTGRVRAGYRDHSSENNQIFFADFGVKLGERWENRIYVTLNRLDRDLPGGLSKEQLENDPRRADPTAIAQDWNKSWTYARIADRLAFRSDRLDFITGVFWHHRDLTERGFFDPGEFREGIEQFYSDNYGASAQLTFRSEIGGRRTIFTFGGSSQFEFEHGQNYENLRGSPGATTARGENNSINAPFYAEAQFYLTDHFSLLGGTQLIYAQRRYVDDFKQPPAGDQSHRQNFYGANPKFGAIYEFDAETQIFANFSRSCQPPTLDNLTAFTQGPDSALVYTPLSSQRAWTAEIGTRGERGIAHWELSFYYSRLRDELLELNDANGNEIGTVNVRRSSHRGVEAGLELDLLKSLLVHGHDEQTQDRLILEQTYTFNDFHFDGDPVYGDNRIAGIPIHFYEMQLLYQLTMGIYLGPNLRCNLTSYPVDQANTLYVDPYALVGFKIGYRSKKNWSVFVEAKNLGDTHYPASVDAIADARAEDDLRIFQPGDGRSFYGGISWRW